MLNTIYYLEAPNRWRLYWDLKSTPQHIIVINPQGGQTYRRVGKLTKEHLQRAIKRFRHLHCYTQPKLL